MHVHVNHPDGEAKFWLSPELTLAPEAFVERAARGLTGDWLVYAKHHDRNYYLDLATHEDGSKEHADHLLTRLKDQSNAEYPFLFQHET